MAMRLETRYRLWESRWKSALAAASRLGGHHLELEIGPPASEDRIAAVEATIGSAIPADLREILREYSASVKFRWLLPDDLELPPPLRSIFSGDCHWVLDLLPQM